MLIAHITIALASLIMTGAAWYSPSKSKLRLSYGLVFATIASGFVLIAQNREQLASVCLSGLAYLAVAGLGIILARKKMAKV